MTCTAPVSSARSAPGIPTPTVEALGGPRMAEAGAVIRFPIEGLAAFGLVEVVTKLRAHLRLLRALREDFRAGRTIS